MIIQKANVAHISGIVDLHIREFSGFNLSRLGSDFLFYFYSSLVRSEFVRCLVVISEGEIIGFVVGLTNRKVRVSKLLYRQPLRLLKVLLYSVIQDPKRIWILLSMRNSFDKIDPSDSLEYAELLSIAVRSDYHGKSLSKSLLMRFESVMRLNGVKFLSLTTDKYNNGRANSFYAKLGYSIYYEIEVGKSRVMNRYLKSLNG